MDLTANKTYNEGIYNRKYYLHLVNAKCFNYYLFIKKKGIYNI